MRSQLPPTDTSQRPDLKSWENAQLNEALKNQNRLDTNVSKRKKAIKELLKNRKDVNINDDRSWYTPRYFNKVVKINEKGEPVYNYEINGNKYWE